MTGFLKIVAPGPFSTIQDAGRYGYQNFGVPVSGALDIPAWTIANALVGNDPGEAAIEFRFVGPSIAVVGEDRLVALTGTSAALEIEGTERRHILSWSSGVVREGEVIHAPTMKDTSTAYIAISGGIGTVPVLGSRATYVRGQVGGFDGRILQAGDEIPIGKANSQAGPAVARPLSYGVPGRLRIVLGPQDHLFSKVAIAALERESFVVTPQSDRMGLRLEGPDLSHEGDYNIISDGIATGAIQVPGNRQPILLLADHQTTGGYPKIACVIHADLPAAARLRPGDAVSFEVISLDEAEEISRNAIRTITETIRAIRPIRMVGDVDLEALYHESLISGVV